MGITLFTDMATPLVILSCLIVGIAPVVGAALIGGISSLLGGIFKGKGKKQEQKQAFELWKKSLGERRSMLEGIKPQTPYYGIERNLPTIDPVVQKAVMGLLQQRTGGLGIDFQSLFSQLGQTPTTSGGTIRGGTVEPRERKPLRT